MSRMIRFHQFGDASVLKLEEVPTPRPGPDEVLIRTQALGVSWRRDLLATLGEDLGGGSWSLRLQVRPLMRYVWLGSVLMALGGLIATLDKRYRRRRETAEEAAAAAAAAAASLQVAKA